MVTMIDQSFPSGFLFIYEVENYALKPETDPPRCKWRDLFTRKTESLPSGLRAWRGHIDSVTGLQYIDQST